MIFYSIFTAILQLAVFYTNPGNAGCVQSNTHKSSGSTGPETRYQECTEEEVFEDETGERRVHFTYRVPEGVDQSRAKRVTELLDEIVHYSHIKETPDNVLLSRVLEPYQDVFLPHDGQIRQQILSVCKIYDFDGNQHRWRAARWVVAQLSSLESQ